MKKAADQAEHLASLEKEETDKQALLDEANKKRAAREAEEAKAAALSPAENHMSIRRIRKGDKETVPAIGDIVAISYTGHFAPGTEHQGTAYEGQFDSSLRKEPKREGKVERPLIFRMGDGKAIRLEASPTLSGLLSDPLWPCL